MFDWRQVQRFRINKDKLPPDTIFQFKDPSFWDLYKWPIIGVTSVCTFEAFLIFALLAQRTRRKLSEERFSKAFRSSPDALVIVRRADGILLDVNNNWPAILGYSPAEALGRTTLDLGLYTNVEDRSEFYRVVEEQSFIHDFETEFRRKDGELLLVNLSAELITINRVECLIVIVRDITERKRAEEALRKSEEALRASHSRIEDLAGRLIVAQEEERKHIGRELHDDLNQQVAGLAIALGKLKRRLSETNSPAQNQMPNLEGRITRLSEQIRRLSHELHSSTLEHIGLAEALKIQCFESLEQQGIAVSLELEDVNKRLHPDVELCLYRVAQESLRNVAKHSGAKRAELSLVISDGSVEMRIADQGAGFDPEKQRRLEGIGLVSMEERARLLGGHLEVKSQPGIGTELRISVPAKGRDKQKEKAAGG
jgi:PAS domain S-box-containing protein